MQTLCFKRHIQRVRATAAGDQTHFGIRGPGHPVVRLSGHRIAGINDHSSRLMRKVEYVGIAAAVLVIDAGGTPVTQEAVTVRATTTLQRSIAGAGDQQVIAVTADQRGPARAADQDIVLGATDQCVIPLSSHQDDFDVPEPRRVDHVLALAREADNALYAGIGHRVLGTVQRGGNLHLAIADFLQDKLFVAIRRVLVLAVFRILGDQCRDVEVDSRIGRK